jgi:hypothetical protein
MIDGSFHLQVLEFLVRSAWFLFWPNGKEKGRNAHNALVHPSGQKEKTIPVANTSLLNPSSSLYD